MSTSPTSSSQAKFTSLEDLAKVLYDKSDPTPTEKKVSAVAKKMEEVLNGSPSEGDSKVNMIRSFYQSQEYKTEGRESVPKNQSRIHIYDKKDDFLGKIRMGLKKLFNRFTNMFLDKNKQSFVIYVKNREATERLLEEQPIVTTNPLSIKIPESTDTSTFQIALADTTKETIEAKSEQIARTIIGSKNPKELDLTTLTTLLPQDSNTFDYKISSYASIIKKILENKKDEGPGMYDPISQIWQRMYEAFQSQREPKSCQTIDELIGATIQFLPEEKGVREKFLTFIKTHPYTKDVKEQKPIHMIALQEYKTKHTELFPETPK